MTTRAKMVVFAAAAIALAPAAHADTYDQKLTELRTKFNASDANRDGKLTKQEARTGGMTNIAAYFGRIDTDRDGFVTLTQLEAQLAARFK